nr:MAG TPA: Protein of unknown function DUF115 [Caudoviricetes sp.]
MPLIVGNGPSLLRLLKSEWKRKKKNKRNLNENSTGGSGGIDRHSPVSYLGRW